MKVVLDSIRDVPAGGEMTFCDNVLGRHTMRGPGIYHIKMVEFGERRTATKQRRARWVAGGRLSDPARRITSQSGMGRRANDVVDHKERRCGVMVWVNPAFNPRRRKGDERRANYSYPYGSSPDPRIRALERRKS